MILTNKHNTTTNQRTYKNNNLKESKMKNNKGFTLIYEDKLFKEKFSYVYELALR